MSTALQRNVGAYIHAAEECALDAATITAAAGNDGVEVNGNVIDRLKSGRHLFLSGKLIIQWKAVLTDTKTLTIAANMRHADNSGMSTNVADLTPAYTSTVVATGATPLTTYRGVVEIPINLSSARQYIQAQVTADLSHSGTDTVALSAIFVFGGGDVLPEAGDDTAELSVVAGV